MDAATIAESSVPFERFSRTAMGSKSACLAKRAVLHFHRALRRYLRLPGRCGAANVVPLPGGSVEVLELPDDGWEQMRLILEVAFHVRAEDEMRECRFTVLPQRNGIAAREKTFAVPVADGAGVSVAGELVYFLGGFFDRLVGQQLVEADRDAVTIPDRGRRESDGYPVGDGAQDQGLAVGRRQRLFLARQKAILHVRSDFDQEWLLVVQPHEQPEFFPISPAPQFETGAEQGATGQALRFMEIPGGPQAPLNHPRFKEALHPPREFSKPRGYLGGIRVGDRHAGMIEDHLAHVRVSGQAA